MKSVSTLRFASLAAIASAMLAVPGAAHATIAIGAEGVTVEGAQAAEASAPADEQAQDGTYSSGLTEIVVTATKRETNLQKTPIAISVLAPEAIKDRHVQSLIDMADGVVPSLRVATFESRQTALTIGIRGIVPADANQTARDQGVGVYIDGV